MLTIDGAHGEGGGQIVRTALALASALRRPLELTNIRRRRPKPGLQPQHLTVVRALATVCGADVQGATLGASALRFIPGTTRAGSYDFDVAAVTPSAGSVSLLFQALLLPLALAETPSHLVLRGGTHVPWSPVVPYLQHVFLPALASLGLHANVTLQRCGWYPAGGGVLEATVHAWTSRSGFTASATEPAPVLGLSAVSRLPVSIAERQRVQLEKRLGAVGRSARIDIDQDDTARNPGTMVLLAVRGRAGFASLGHRGVSAERVADSAVDEFLAWRASGAAVDVHLADQLVPFLVFAREGSRYTCPAISSHLRTVAWVVRQFIAADIVLDEGHPARVTVTPPGVGQPHPT